MKRRESDIVPPPTYILVSRFADRAGVNRQMVLRIMRNAGAATKIGRRWYTTRRWLRELFPDAWSEFVNAWPDDTGYDGHDGHDGYENHKAIRI